MNKTERLISLANSAYTHLNSGGPAVISANLLTPSSVISPLHSVLPASSVSAWPLGRACTATVSSWTQSVYSLFDSLVDARSTPDRQLVVGFGSGTTLLFAGWGRTDAGFCRGYRITFPSNTPGSVVATVLQKHLSSGAGSSISPRLSRVRLLRSITVCVKPGVPAVSPETWDSISRAVAAFCSSPSNRTLRAMAREASPATATATPAEAGAV